MSFIRLLLTCIFLIFLVSLLLVFLFLLGFVRFGRFSDLGEALGDWRLNRDERVIQVFVFSISLLLLIA